MNKPDWDEYSKQKALTKAYEKELHDKMMESYMKNGEHLSEFERHSLAEKISDARYEADEQWVSNGKKTDKGHDNYSSIVHENWKEYNDDFHKKFPGDYIDFDDYE